MGSKRALLAGGLGQQLELSLVGRDRFVDLFAGSGVVSHYVSERSHVDVLAGDLQEYSRALSASVIERRVAVPKDWFVSHWVAPARRDLEADGRAPEWRRLSDAASSVSVYAARELCESQARADEHIVRAYGGHYFSPIQALAVQKLLARLPSRWRDTALASLLRAASRCAAAPGHTAQPFQPTAPLLAHIRAAWMRDPLVEVLRPESLLSAHFARAMGVAVVGDAADVAGEVMPGDLVFLDPPYSDAQYSRFYHVLEGIAVGGYHAVSGAGRAPDAVERASSQFSLKSSAQSSLVALIEKLLANEAQVLLTIPMTVTTNGLSVERLVDELTPRALIDVQSVESVHSTLGGASGGRDGRKSVQEGILYFRAR